MSEHRPSAATLNAIKALIRSEWSGLTVRLLHLGLRVVARAKTSDHETSVAKPRMIKSVVQRDSCGSRLRDVIATPLLRPGRICWGINFAARLAGSFVFKFAPV